MGFVEPTKYTWDRGDDGQRRKRPVRGTPWKARFRDRQGRARARTFPTKTEAQAYLERTGADLQRGDYIDPIEQRRHFRDWATIWWDTTYKLRPSTRTVYWRILQRHVLPYFGNQSMGTIDWFEIEMFIAAKLKEGLSPKKVRDAVSVVSLIMKCAVRANARKDNPAAGHSIPVPRKKLRPGDVPDMGEAERLVAHTKDPYKPAVWLLIYTGMRPSELCGLRVRSIDFGRRLVSITETLMPVNRFEESPYGLVKGPTKTEAGDRDIPIPQWLCDDLAAMVRARADGRGPVSQDDYLFLRPTGIPLNRDKFRQDVIRPALKAAGLPEALRTYDLRHSHASLLIDQGANVLAVAQRMGHSDPVVTLRVYGHLFAGAQEDLTERLDNLRSSTLAKASGEVVSLDKYRKQRDE
jgi:integrase